MSYAEFFKVHLNGLDLFILLMHIPISNKYMLSTLTFPTVLYYEVSDLCIALTLTMLPGIVDF